MVTIAHGTATPTEAAATGGESSTPGMVGKASGVVSGAAGEGAAGERTSSLEADGGEARACSSRWASKMGITMIQSIVLTSSSNTMSIEMVAERSRMTSSREGLEGLNDTGESKESNGVRGTHSSGSLLGALVMTSIGLLGIGVTLLPESVDQSRDVEARSVYIQVVV